MRYSALPILLVLFSITFNSTQAEVVQSSEVVVIQIQNFDSEKNMAMYALFQNDENVVIVNSCDVLGMVVLDVKQNSMMSRAEAKAYVDVKVNGVLDFESYEVRVDQEAMQVLMDCRAEMQRQLTPNAE